MTDGTEVNETAEKLTHKKKADFNLKLEATLLLYKFYALIFAVDFRFSLCYPHPPKRQKKIFVRIIAKNVSANQKSVIKNAQADIFFCL